LAFLCAPLFASYLPSCLLSIFFCFSTIRAFFSSSPRAPFYPSNHRVFTFSPPFFSFCLAMERRRCFANLDPGIYVNVLLFFFFPIMSDFFFLLFFQKVPPTWAYRPALNSLSHIGNGPSHVAATVPYPFGLELEYLFLFYPRPFFLRLGKFPLTIKGDRGFFGP